MKKVNIKAKVSEKDGSFFIMFEDNFKQITALQETLNLEQVHISYKNSNDPILIIKNNQYHVGDFVPIN